QSCGNGSRCIARLLMDESGKDIIVLETLGGPIRAWREHGDLISVDMGRVGTGWQDIPLAAAADTLHVPVSEGPLREPVAVNVGNPHAVFFVPDVMAIDLPSLGPKLEHHPMFPQRINVEVVQVMNRTHL